jgi:hypothetical protein
MYIVCMYACVYVYILYIVFIYVCRDEHGTGTGTVPIPYQISGTDFFPSIISGTGTVPNGIRIPVPVPVPVTVSVPVSKNRVFPFFSGISRFGTGPVPN